jgi:hypothetical protein
MLIVAEQVQLCASVRIASHCIEMQVAVGRRSDYCSMLPLRAASLCLMRLSGLAGDVMHVAARSSASTHPDGQHTQRRASAGICRLTALCGA